MARTKDEWEEFCADALAETEDWPAVNPAMMQSYVLYLRAVVTSLHESFAAGHSERAKQRRRAERLRSHKLPGEAPLWEE